MNKEESPGLTEAQRQLRIGDTVRYKDIDWKVEKIHRAGNNTYISISSEQGLISGLISKFVQ